MDPNTTWQEICQLLDRPDVLINKDQTYELLLRLDALTKWLAKDGFVPPAANMGANALGILLEALTDHATWFYNTVSGEEFE